MKLADLLGTKYPLIQGGMANIATGEFAAAVSNAGGLGLIAAGSMNAETLICSYIKLLLIFYITILNKWYPK